MQVCSIGSTRQQFADPAREQISMNKFSELTELVKIQGLMEDHEFVAV